jgi:hypothetical protein
VLEFSATCAKKTRSVRVQTVTVATCSVEVQCSRRPAISSTGLVDACAEADNDEDYYMDNEDTDPSYNPSSDSDNDDEQSASNAANRKSPVTSISSECMIESKYIVYEAMLMSLFTVCLMCKNATQGVVKFIVGSMVAIEQSCSSCHFHRLWRSQPYIGSFPAGNIQMSAAILFSGSSPRKVFRMMDIFKVAHICARTFSRHQEFCLLPAIRSVWSTRRALLLDEIMSRDTGLVLGGDGRADSPGHSAKFGSYTMVDLHTNKVIDVQLVQSNEVKSSYHMELEGLKRSLAFLTSNDISVSRLVTDRHAQVAKWMRENYPEVDHRYDVWHIGKSISKKLDKAAKYAECSSISDWTKSIINHLYWTAGSTTDGDGAVMIAKWQSVVNHMHNVHTNHSQLFTACQHEVFDDNQVKRTKWIKPNTKASTKVEAIVLAKLLQKDILKLSPAEQTFAVESYHCVINYFAPKLHVFSYHGMYGRLLLAALHYNENAHRSQAATRDGTLRCH